MTKMKTACLRWKAPLQWSSNKDSSLVLIKNGDLTTTIQTNSTSKTLTTVNNDRPQHLPNIREKLIEHRDYRIFFYVKSQHDSQNSYLFNKRPINFICIKNCRCILKNGLLEPLNLWRRNSFFRMQFKCLKAREYKWDPKRQVCRMSSQYPKKK